ncbi:winged helix-turn-helix domain-containing protein [archaeon]|nr:winged helix-turn-helix domain-containing protein [archaeon]
MSADELSENIKILATDDKKIKSFGEILSNDSSREILQLLFNDELTASQIAQKSAISLQLVKYHLNKLQNLGVVTVSKIEKNSKSQDMKIYTASKFSIVIVPPKMSEKTKEGKLLVRSFRHIYKVAGLGIATGLSGLLSLSQFQNKTIRVDDFTTDGEISSIEESAKNMGSMPSGKSMESIHAPSQTIAESESPDIAESGMDVVNTAVNSELAVGPDFFLPFTVITIILGGLTAYYLWKFRKSNLT